MADPLAQITKRQKLTQDTGTIAVMNSPSAAVNTNPPVINYAISPAPASGTFGVITVSMTSLSAYPGTQWANYERWTGHIATEGGAYFRMCSLEGTDVYDGAAHTLELDFALEERGFDGFVTRTVEAGDIMSLSFGTPFAGMITKTATFA